MPGTFHCSVVTPENKAFEGEVSSAIIPAHDGEMGVLVNHAPILAQVGQGSLKLTLDNGQTQEFQVAGGFAQMKDNNLTVLTDKADQAAAV